MQNIIEIIKEIGLEVSEDKVAELNKKVADNYLTRAEFDKKLGRAETERDNYKAQLETAQETLKSFEGVDVQSIQGELSTLRTKLAEAERDAAAKLAQRDFDDALKAKFDALKFTSESAKKAVMDEIRAKGLKLDNGVILGFDDAIQAIKARDASAFLDESNPPARFTTRIPGTPAGKKYNSVDDRPDSSATLKPCGKFWALPGLSARSPARRCGCCARACPCSPAP